MRPILIGSDGQTAAALLGDDLVIAVFQSDVHIVRAVNESERRQNTELVVRAITNSGRAHLEVVVGFVRIADIDLRKVIQEAWLGQPRRHARRNPREPGCQRPEQ